MTTSLITSPSRSLASWLLIATPLLFVPAIASTVLVAAAAPAGPPSYFTPEQIRSAAGAWIAAAIFLVLVMAVGNLGIILIGRAVRPAGRPWVLLAQVAAGLSAAAGLAAGVARIAALGTTETDLELDPALQSSLVVGLVAFGLSLVAIALLCFGLVAGRVSGLGAVVLGVIAAVVFVAFLLLRESMPPFVVALLWLPLGILWLRGRSGSPAS